MLEKIKEQITKYYNLQESKWIFMSCFDNNNNLVVSNWVLYTDKPLDKVIEMIYHGLIEKKTNINKIICDIITKIEQKNTIDEINNINISIQGICIQTIDNSKSWVLLPWTIWIHNIQEAFNNIKKKNNIDGNINIYSFDIQRIEIV